MDCCAAEGTNKFFTRWSRTYRKRFRRKGLEKAQRYLVEGITQQPLASKTILEIGCGVGGLHLILLQHGAASSVGIDIAEGMINHAKELACELGLESKARYYVGDFVAMNGEIPESDVTILDKVVCCYENVEALMEKSVSKTRQTYALSFPGANPLIKFFFKTQILIGKLLRFSFRPYWHDWERICAAIQSRGFREIYRNKTFLWSVRVYRKQ